MISLKESSPKIGILMLLLICLSVLILKGACQTAVCPTSYQCKHCANETYGCIDCYTGQGLSMEYYPSANYICADCGAFCSNCLNRTNCTECSPGYGPLGGPSCSACIIPNCLTCPVAVQTCKQCKPGYAFYQGSNACGACSQHCLYGCDLRLPTNCDRCDPGYGYMTGTFVCGACSLHCAAGCNGTGAGKCDQCDAGYGTVSDGSCAPITTTPIITTTTTPTTTTTITTTTITAAPTSGQASSQTTGQTSRQTTGQTSSQTTGQTSSQITGQTSSQITGQTSSQITGQTNATLNAITGATGTTGYPNGGSTKAPGDRFNSNTAIMATLLSLILGGIVISIFVIGCWASRFSQAAAVAAAASTQAAAIRTPILQEPVRRMVTVPENYRLLRN